MSCTCDSVCFAVISCILHIDRIVMSVKVDARSGGLSILSLGRVEWSDSTCVGVEQRDGDRVNKCVGHF